MAKIMARRSSKQALKLPVGTEFFSLDEVAKILKCSRRTVYREIADGHLPPIQKVDGKALVEADAVQKLVELRSLTIPSRGRPSVERELSELRAKEDRAEEAEHEKNVRERELRILEKLEEKITRHGQAPHEKQEEEPQSFLEKNGLALLTMSVLAFLAKPKPDNEAAEDPPTEIDTP